MAGPEKPQASPPPSPEGERKQPNLTPEQVKARAEETREAKIEREKLEQIAKIVDFLTELLPETSKEKLTELLTTSPQDEQSRLFNDAVLKTFSEIAYDYPELSDKGKNHLEKLIKERGIFNTMNYMVGNRFALRTISAFQHPEGIPEKLEQYAKDMLEIKFNGVATGSLVSVEFGYTVYDESGNKIEEQNWQRHP